MRTEKINDMWVVAQFECVIPSAEESAADVPSVARDLKIPRPVPSLHSGQASE